MTGGSRRSGFPSAPSSRCTRSSDRSIRFGCRLVSRATMESIWVMACLSSTYVVQHCPAKRDGRDHPAMTNFVVLRQCLGVRRNWQLLSILLTAGCGRSSQQSAEFSKCWPQLVSMHDHIDHAVFGEIFGALKTVGQFFTYGLLDHARTSKTDQRAWLGDLHIAKHCVRSSNSTGGRIGQHDDVRLARFTQHLHADGCAW